MRTRMLGICLSLGVVSSAYGNEANLVGAPVNEVAEEIDQGRTLDVTINVVDFITKQAAHELTIRNQKDVADDLSDRWNSVKGQLRASFDLGDHAPLNDYLADMYQQIEDVLGPEVISQTRLHDIKVINYGIPVVLDPTMTSGKWNHANPRVEYSVHFVPLAGTLAYWAARASCQASSMPGGICGAASALSQKLMTERVAPGLSDKVYDRANAAQ
jgi:hypothetical protein